MNQTNSLTDHALQVAQLIDVGSRYKPLAEQVEIKFAAVHLLSAYLEQHLERLGLHLEADTVHGQIETLGRKLVRITRTTPRRGPI